MRKTFTSATFCLTTIAYILFAGAFEAGAQDFWGKAKAPFAGYVECLAVDSDNNIYAGTWGDGVHISVSSGATFTRHGSGIEGTHINDIYINENDDLFAATEGDGIYFLSEGSNSWTSKNNGLANMNVRVINEHSDGTLFAGTYGGGMFRSGDNGESWEEINQGLFFMDISTIEFATNEDYIVVGTFGGGVYRSDDMGDNWQKSSGGLTNDYINDMIINTQGELYAATNGRGVLLSVNNGLSWTEYDTNMTDLNLTSLIFNSDQWLVASSRSAGIKWYDPDVYMEWRNSDLSRSGINDMVRAPNGDMYAAKPLDGIYRSTNEGHFWTRTDAFYQNDSFGPIAADENSDDMILAHRSNRVYYSDNNGYEWEPVGFEGDAIVDFAFGPGNRVYCVSEGTGLHVSDDNGVNWDLLGFADSSLISVAVNSTGDIFAGGVHIEDGDPPTITPFFARSTDDGATWTVTEGMFPATSQCRSITVKSNGAIYMGTNSGGILKSTDNGDTWEQFTTYEETPEAKFILFNSLNHMFVGAYKGVFRTTNDGGTWVKDSFGLISPNVEALSINTSDHIFAGFDGSTGSYYTTDNGNDWDSTNPSYNISPVKGMTSNDNGFTAMSTNMIYRAIDPAEFDAPQLTSPASGTFGIELNPTLDWEPAEFADMYELQLSTKNNFTFRVEYVTLAPTIRDIQKTLNYNTKYYWRARSVLYGARSDWSSVFTFTTEMEPPRLIDPANEAKGIQQTYDFVWHASDGAETYVLEIATDNSFDNIFINQADIADTTFQVNGLDPFTDYHWRVKAVNVNSESRWSEKWTFKTVVAPPELRSPTNHTEGLPTTVMMEWSESEGANAYIIQVASDENFDQMVYNGQSDELTSHELNLLEFNTKYYWRVQAGNDDGYGLFSEAWDYTTGIAPVDLISPENNAVDQPVELQFTWQTDETEIELFHYQLASDDGFNDIVLEDSSLTEMSIDIQGLEYYSNYYWRVRLKKGGNWSFWSQTYTFLTGLGKPVLSDPANDTKDINLSLNFIWEPLKGAEYYRLEVSTDEAFANKVKDIDSISNDRIDVYDFSYKTTYYWRIMAFNKEGESPYSDTWTFTTLEGESVFELPENIDYLDLFPNPASRHINIVFRQNTRSNVSLRLLEISGRVVFEKTYGIIPAEEKHLNVNISGLAAGSYLLELNTGANSAYRQINVIE